MEAKTTCNFCEEEFAHNKNAERHRLYCNKNPDNIRNKLECPCCKRKFSRKDYLSVHTKKCSIDKNTVSITSSLQCPSCFMSFNRKARLSAHMKRGNCENPSIKKVSCLYGNCDFNCLTKKKLIHHLRKEHDHNIKPVQTLHFNTESEFQAWKETEEARTYSYYSKNSGQKGNRYYLYCQHNGSDYPHRNKNSEGRKTSRKVKIGQIKTGKVCLSKINVVEEEDGSRKVEYYESHSHSLSKNDLAHQPTSLSVNNLINDQLAFNVPPREIFKILQSSYSDRENREISTTNTRNLTITEKRIRQRATRKRSNLRLHQSDAVSVRILVDSLQQEKYVPVLIYKPIGENFVVGPKEFFNDNLPRDLFMLGLQTNEQRKLLVKYSSRVVIVDDTHNVTQYENVKLFNMLITDENNRGWPVGHLISNCMAAEFLKYFICAIKIRCEEAGELLTINCIISDDDPALINGIEEGMCQNINHILCQWHLDNTFKDNIRAKAPRDMFDTIYTELKVIISEKNKETFSTLFNIFLHSHSEDAPDFVRYLKEYYSERKEKWAMCFREGLGHGNINTTGHAESFHNRLKTGEFKRIPNKRMDDLCNILLNLERRDFQERQRLDILGITEPSYKCKEKHDRGTAISDNSIAEIRNDMWVIESESIKSQFYLIVRVEDFCPKDLCYDKCINPSCHGLCAHLFHCSCKDIFALCKHLHKLQSFLLKDCPVPAYEDESSDVKFYTVENELPQSTLMSSQNNFSETNTYARVEANLAVLAKFVCDKTIPKHLLNFFDTQISDLVKKAKLLLASGENMSSMPSSRRIPAKEKIKTQFCQTLPFKRKTKSKKNKLNPIEMKKKKEAAKESLLALSESGRFPAETALKRKFVAEKNIKNLEPPNKKIDIQRRLFSTKQKNKKQSTVSKPSVHQTEQIAASMILNYNKRMSSSAHVNALLHVSSVSHHLAGTCAPSSSTSSLRCVAPASVLIKSPSGSVSHHLAGTHAQSSSTSSLRYVAPASVLIKSPSGSVSHHLAGTHAQSSSTSSLRYVAPASILIKSPSGSVSHHLAGIHAQSNASPSIESSESSGSVSHKPMQQCLNTAEPR